MAKKDINQEDGVELFYEAMKDVTRLTHNKIPPTTPAARKQPIKQQTTITKPPFYFEQQATLETVDQDTYLAFKKPDLAAKLLRKLQKGQYNVQAILDLHGLTVQEAES